MTDGLDEALWQQVLDHFRTGGPVDGNRVLVVDANRVMTTPDKPNDAPPHADFGQGANDQEANWVKREFGPRVLLLDDRIRPDDWPFILAHECLEAKLMRERMYSYERAHEAANRFEMSLRRRAIASRGG